MKTQTLAKINERMPEVFDSFFKPWNEWFDHGDFPGRTINRPAVNITEEKNQYLVSLAIPGMKKEDFSINLEGNMLTIKCEKEEDKEEKEKKYTRKEYNYSFFSRSFTLPEGIKMEGIHASYQNGILDVALPRTKEEATDLVKKVPIE